MTVTGGGGSSVAIGSNMDMTYCSTNPVDTAAAPNGGAHGADGSTIDVKIEPTGSGVCGNNSFSTRTDGGSGGGYDINFYNGQAFTYTLNGSNFRVYSTWLFDCMSSTGGGQIGTTISENLNYTSPNVTTYSSVSLPAVTSANAGGDASAVCFSNDDGSQANQVPIIITA
jgi:hypothetical protein